MLTATKRQHPERVALGLAWLGLPFPVTEVWRFTHDMKRILFHLTAAAAGCQDSGGHPGPGSCPAHTARPPGEGSGVGV